MKKVSISSMVGYCSVAPSNAWAWERSMCVKLSRLNPHATLAGPEALYARSVLLEELEAALEELPEEQSHVFIAHEMGGRSFKQLAEETGLSINSLLSRKHYAVLHLRRRLDAIYEEFTSS